MKHIACSLSLDRVIGRPYEVTDDAQLWTVYISSPSRPLEQQVIEIARFVTDTPCVALMRVYGEVESPHHVFHLSSSDAVVPLLDRCEGIGVFHSADVTHDQNAILRELASRSRPNDDEACLIRAVQPRPVIFLHAGHDDIDVVCQRRDAEKLMNYLLELGYPVGQ